MKPEQTSNGTAVELTLRSPGCFDARGPLTFATAKRARQLGLEAFARTSEASEGGIEVDCSGITSSDSAGMTVLLDWLAFAKRSSRTLRFGNLPPQVQAIARISDVLDLLERGV